MKRLINWYANLTTKQRTIIWIASLLISAFPFIGWVFIAPWLIPFMLFIEFQSDSINKKKQINDEAE